ncbi:hypothetical protein K7H92_21220, partial [Pseudomonas stutzeri]|nr:hypothetical protein [Stutzerimonas stutzeri]
EYTVTQKDLDEGQIVNIAKSKGIDPKNNPVEDESTITAHAQIKNELNIVKTIGSGDNYKKVGDKIVYNFVITNSGNTTISGVKVVDPLIKGEILLTKNQETTSSKLLTMEPGD